jgi:beta-lactamase superfamily II metal-dependent hydrolase
MTRKRKRYEKIKPSAVLAILVIILAIYIASFFLEALRHPIGGEVVTNSHSAGEVTHSSGELGEIEYHFIDVGQGDATLIRTPEGDILIDAGENSAEDELKAYLDLQGVEVLYYAIFTHPDSDHIGGADMILEEYEVLNVIKPEFEKTTKVYKAMMDAIAAEGCTVYNALPGETYSLGEFDMFVFGPDPTNKDLDSNNSSIVIKATWGKTTAMLTGDAEKPAEESILRTYSGAELGSMLLKMGHHGSRTSSTEAWLAAVRPTIAIISCGKDNSYGHPHAEALARIEPYVGELIYRTDLLGSIVFISNGETFIYQD